MVGLIGALVALHVGTAAAAELVIVHATILPVVGPPITDGTLVVSDGRITAVGAALPVPPGAVEVVDAGGAYLLPGLIDLHSHMGVYPWPGGPAHSDGNEATHPTTPAVWTGDSVRVLDPAFRAASAGGVTSALVLPGSANLIGGEGVVLKLRPGRTLHDMRFDGAPRHLKMACGENPKRVYGQKSGPSTRMGNGAGYRDAFQKAREYQRNWDKYRRDHKKWQTDKDKPPPASPPGAPPGAEARRPDEPTPPNLDLAMETLAGVLRGEILVHNHCYRADEMSLMLEISASFGFKIRSFHHATEAYKIADRLAAADVAASVWADWWGFKAEAFDGIRENAAMLARAGARAIIHSDSPIGIQRLNQEAAKAMYAGRRVGIDISEDTALKWITLNPAWALGIDARTGTLEPGKFADVVVWSGSPFSVYSVAEQVFIAGEPVYVRGKTTNQADFDLGYRPAGVP